MDIRPIDARSMDDLGRLLGATANTAGCWCMWFIIPVKTFHAGGDAGNRARFAGLMETDPQPLGLLAYEAGDPVGWCAIGPRARYARALGTPTYRQRSPGDDTATWLLPCLFVRRDRRGTGLGEALIRAAGALARRQGATAVEAFPHVADKRQSGDLQVGFAPLFARCGFIEIARPSPSRTVMRLDLA